MASKINVKVPRFDSVNKPYEMYRQEIDMWKVITKVDKNQRGVILAYELPDDDPSDIRTKLFNEVKLADLNTDDGLTVFTNYMDKHFKKDDLSETYLRYSEFSRCTRGKNETVKNFVTRYDKLYNMAAKKGVTYQNNVLAFKLLDDVKVNEFDRKCILLEMDFSKQDELYEGVKKSLLKFKGQEITTTGARNMQSETEPAIKLEEEAMYTDWNKTSNFNNRGGSTSRNGRNFYNQRYAAGYNNSTRFRTRQSGGAFRPGRTYRSANRRSKPVNPRNPRGGYMTCLSCGSFRHMVESCPHSWESMEREDEKTAEGAYLGELEEAFVASASNDMIVEDSADVLLYTGNNEDEVALLGVEASNSALLDCGCTSNVCGVEWMYSFLDCLDDELKNRIVIYPGQKTFRFGGGERLKSMGVVTFPCRIAGEEYEVTTNIVDSKIPLLLSTETMKDMGVILDLVSDRIKIFGKWINVNRTTAGHYAVDIRSPIMRVDKVEECLITLEDKTEEEQLKLLRKVHRQFGHPTKERWNIFVQNFKGWKEKYRNIIDKIYDECNVCPQFKRSPPRPVVSLPVASNFNEVVTLDLKERIVNMFRYILHMIDAFTRFSVSIFIKDKRPQTISDVIMKHWIGAGYGVFKRMWTDVGGEFNAEEIKQLSDVLGIKVDTTAGYAAWMNGLNERNHSVIDRCYEKIVTDWPAMNPETALAWAVNAKNAMPMHNGFSSYQLVYGKNPNLPNIFSDKLPSLEGTTTSETIAEHIQALHTANKAFQEVQCDYKIRLALAHKVRAVERVYEKDEMVYFKRDGNNKWRGPAKVIGNDGSVYFIKFQGNLVRLAACRLVGAKDAEEQIGTTRTPSKIAVKSNKIVSKNVAFQETVESSEVDGIVTDEEVNTEEEGNCVLPTKGDTVLYRKEGENDWKKVQIEKTDKRWISKRWYNVSDGENKYSINLNVIKDWKISNKDEVVEIENDMENETEHVENLESGPDDSEGDKVDEVCYVTLIPLKDYDLKECVAAKKRELDSWIEFKVFTELPDEGQECLSHRWILTEKHVSGEKTVKARLVVRGFEEVGTMMQTDSPTGAKESLRIALFIAAMKKWRVKSLDVKSAYLQGEQIKREIYMDPPQEMKEEGVIWKLNKAVYGTMDGARQWYMKLDKNLNEIKCKKSKVDPCFYFHEEGGELNGFIFIHVDDIIHAGNKHFEENVMKEIDSMFKIGRREEDCFVYTGLNIGRVNDEITLDQIEYIQSLRIPDVKNICGSMKAMPLDKKERTLLRKVVGQLNWTARQTRPDMCFDVMELSMKLKDPVKNDLIKACKAMKALKMNDVRVVFPVLSPQISLVTFSDAAFANLSDSVSSGRGYIILAVDDQNKCCTLAWQCNKVKRIVKSTMAAETLALQECIEHVCLLRMLIAELMVTECKLIPIISYVDSDNLRKALESTKQVLDKKLRIDLACIKENVEKESVKVKWVPGEKMVANCLTKSGASSRDLMQVVETGVLIF